MLEWFVRRWTMEVTLEEARTTYTIFDIFHDTLGEKW
jgi:hypothetical protein